MLSISRQACALSRFMSLMRCTAFNEMRFLNQQRNSSEMRCNTMKKKNSNCGIMKEYPCGQKLEEPFKKKGAKKRTLKSMWKIEDCDAGPLCDLDLRYDMKYYSISDKRQRKYQVTWNECPRLVIKPKKVCLYERPVRPKIVRRKRKPASTGGGVASGGKPATCSKTGKVKTKCFYVKTPCCRVGRRPPRCHIGFRSLGSCKKRRTPYPSFSECKKDPSIDLPPVECQCLNLPALCNAWATMRRRFNRGLPAVKRCDEA